MPEASGGVAGSATLRSLLTSAARHHNVARRERGAPCQSVGTRASITRRSTFAVAALRIVLPPQVAALAIARYRLGRGVQQTPFLSFGDAFVRVKRHIPFCFVTPKRQRIHGLSPFGAKSMFASNFCQVYNPY